MKIQTEVEARIPTSVTKLMEMLVLLVTLIAGQSVRARILKPSILSYLIPFFKWPDASHVKATSAHRNSGTSERKQLSSRCSYAEWAYP
jgi:hypothetical protein